MIGICIGVGPTWERVAKRTALRMEKMTGVKSYIVRAHPIEPVTHPSWIKTRLLTWHYYHANESFLIYDADIYPLLPWSPEKRFEDSGRKFCAVKDKDNEAVANEKVDCGLPADWNYVNCGLMVIGMEHAPVLDEAWKYHPKFGSFLEQGAINRALHDLKTPVHLLDPALNVLSGDLKKCLTDGTVNMHKCSTGGDGLELEKCQLESGLFKA